MTTTPEPGTTEAGEQDLERIREATIDSGFTSRWGETNRLIERDESLQAQLAAAQAERDELSEKVAVLNADYDRLYREHVVPLRAQLEQQRTQTEAAQAVVEAANEYRRLAHAQEIHENGCGDNPCETCAVAAGATQEAERALFAALARLPQTEADV